MKFIIGTKNPAKLKAIQEGIEKCNYFPNNSEIEIIGESIDSGVSDMPITFEENIQGAKNRAENLKKLFKKNGEEGDFFIGMEGGTTKFSKDIGPDVPTNKAYLFGAIYILNNNGEGHFGISNLMEVPKSFEKEIYENGGDLGPLLGKATGDSDSHKKGGAFGAWSDMNTTRSDQFVNAFIPAISPFFNKFYK